MRKHVSKRKYITCLMALMLCLSANVTAYAAVGPADDVPDESTVVSESNTSESETSDDSVETDDTSVDSSESTVDVEEGDIVQYDPSSWDGIANFPDEDGHLRYYMDDLNEGKGTLTMTYKYNDESGVSGAEISIYRIADVSVVRGDAKYTVLEGYSDFEYAGASVDALNEYAASQVDTAKQKEAYKTAVTDSEGKVVFEDLEYGMYLVAETDKTGDALKFYDFTPFCVNVPFPDVDEAVYQGHWTYDVEVEPKTEIEKIPESSVPDVPPTPPPVTGEEGEEKHNYAVFYGAAAVIFASVAAIAVIHSKRRDESDEE